MTDVRADAEWLAETLVKGERAVLAASTPQLGFSSIEGGSVDAFDTDGALTTVLGEQFDGTNGAVVFTGPVPPAPVEPSVFPGLGQVMVRWSGKFADGEVSPMDFSHVSVHMAREEVFEPDNTTQVATIRGESGDSALVLAEAGPWAFALVAVSKAGKWSDPSDFVTVEVDDPVTRTDVTDALIDVDERFDGVITEAGQLGSRLDQARADLDAATGRLDQARTDIDSAFVKITDADSKASSALVMAGSKSRVTYSTEVASGSGSVGDVWRQVDAAKNVVAEWFWGESGWQSSLVTSQMVSNLDVGKLTAGSAAINTVTAQKIAAAAGQFIELDVAKLVVTGTATLSQAVVDKLWSEVVHSRKITANMIAVGDFSNLVTNGLGELGQVAGVFGENLVYDTADKPMGAAGSWKCMPGQGTVASTDLLVPVESGAEYLVEIWLKANQAKSRFFLELRDQDGSHAADCRPAIAGSGDPASGNYPFGNGEVPTTWKKFSAIATMKAGTTKVRVGGLYFNHTNGEVRTATVGLNVVIRRRLGGTMVVDGSITAEKLETEMVLASKIIAGKPNGARAVMSPNGFESYANPDGSGFSASIKMGSSGDDFLSIVDASNNTVGSFSSDGKISGSELTSRGDVYYSGNSLIDTLNNKPNGVVAWGGVDVNSIVGLGTGGGEIGMYEIALDATNDGDLTRLYRYTMETALMVTNGSGYAGIRLRYTNDGSAPNINSQIASYWYLPVSGASYIPVGMTRLFQSTRNQYIRILVCLFSTGPSVAPFIGSGAAQGSLFSTVEDLGPTMAQSAILNRGGGGTNPPPAPPAKVTKVQTWNATASRSYTGSGAPYDLVPGNLYQGPSPAGYGDLRSIALFPNSIASTLSGSTVNWVKIYAYAAHWWYNSGGDAKIGTTGATSIPGSLPSTNLAITSPGWPKPGARWVTLPASLNDSWRTGTIRGITFGGRGGGLNEYGFFNDIRVQISYTK